MYHNQHPSNAGRNLGGDPASSAKKEDFAPKEASTVHGGKGTEGCYKLE
jgi:hypothetical protein